MNKCNSTFLIYNRDIRIEHRNNDYFLVLQQLEGKLNNQTEIENVCLHEAAHLIYFGRLGVTKLYLQIPWMFTEGALKFKYRVAAVGALKEQLAAFNIRRLVLLSRGMAAGGAFLRKAQGLSDGGDSDDHYEFLERCTKFCVDTGHAPFNREKMWRRAKKHVEREIVRDPSFVANVRQAASYLQKLLFYRLFA